MHHLPRCLSNDKNQISMSNKHFERCEKIKMREKKYNKLTKTNVPAIGRQHRTIWICTAYFFLAQGFNGRQLVRVLNVSLWLAWKRRHDGTRVRESLNAKRFLLPIIVLRTSEKIITVICFYQKLWIKFYSLVFIKKKIKIIFLFKS